MTNIPELIQNFIDFLNTAVVPFLFALAFLFFLWNGVRYFFIGAAQEDERRKAKALAVYGILAFVIMVGIWGIVNYITGGFGLTSTTPVVPDYFRIQ